MSCEGAACRMPKKAGNAVNEFDDSAWNAAFSQMTEDRKDDDAGSIATKDAMAVVDKIFDDMKTRYFDHLDVMETSVEQFGKVSRLARCFTHLGPCPAAREVQRAGRVAAQGVRRALGGSLTGCVLVALIGVRRM